MTTILSLPGLNVLRVEDAEHDYHVYAETPGNAAACPHCRSDGVVGFGLPAFNQAVPIGRVLDVAAEIERRAAIIDPCKARANGEACG